MLTHKRLFKLVEEKITQVCAEARCRLDTGIDPEGEPFEEIQVFDIPSSELSKVDDLVYKLRVEHLYKNNWYPSFQLWTEEETEKYFQKKDNTYAYKKDNTETVNT